MKKYSKLLWKDWRVNRVIVIGLVLAGVVPYMIGIATLLWNRHEYWLVRHSDSTWAGGFSDYPYWENYLRNASAAATMFTAILAAVFGGVAFAQERRDRSAEFLAMMPARRSQIIYSKLFISAACVLGAMAIHGGIAAGCTTRQSHWVQYLLRDLSLFWIASIGLFGIAWLFSTFLNSPAIAASISIGTVIFVFGCIAVFVPTLGNQNADIGAVVAAFMGMAGVLAGSIYYAGRVAP